MKSRVDSEQATPAGNGDSASGRAQRVPAHSLVRGNDRLSGFLLELLDDGRGPHLRAGDHHGIDFGSFDELTHGPRNALRRDERSPEAALFQFFRKDWSGQAR